MGLSPSAAADAILENRVSFDYGFAAIYLFALYGVSTFKVYFILYLNYKIATRLPRPYVPAATWIFNLAVLFCNKYFNGYPLVDIATSLVRNYERGIEEVPLLVQWAEQIDGYKGLLGRWEVLFNITVLRLISFNLDYYWSHSSGSSSPIEVLQPTHEPTVSSKRQLTPKRRNSSIPPIYPKETVSLSLPNQPTTRFVIT